MQRIENYINGEFCAPDSGEYLDNVEPATGVVYSQIPESNQKDLTRAVTAAQQAFPAWSSTSIDDRSPKIRQARLRVPILGELPYLCGD